MTTRGRKVDWAARGKAVKAYIDANPYHSRTQIRNPKTHETHHDRNQTRTDLS